MKAFTSSPIFRKIGIPVYRFYARQCRYLPPPKVLAMSMPKAGTHLLAKLLSTMPQMMFSGLHLSEEDVFDGPAGTACDSQLRLSTLESNFRNCRNGQYMTGHFPAVKKLRGSAVEHEMRMLLVLRDLRDVAVSYVHYVTGNRRHFHYRYYNQVLTSFDARLMATIVGFPGSAETGGRGLASIGHQASQYMPWLSDAEVTVARFERLVGPGGGGDQQAQWDEVAKIGRAVNRPLSSEQVRQLSESVFSTKARTFRRGKIGGWRDSFQPHHVMAFKETAGQQLIELGYEVNLDW